MFHLELEEGERGSIARNRLIMAGLEEFGARSLEGARTREIARKAGQNIASINYYFGGKEGLYVALAAVMTSKVRSLVEPVFTEVDARMEELRSSQAPASHYIPVLQRLLSPLASMLVGEDEIASLSLIIIREQIRPTEAFNIYFEQVMRPMHERVTSLVALATGRPASSRESILRAHALVGQVLVFRMARETLRRRLQWEDVGPAEKRQMYETILESIEALIQGFIEASAQEDE